MAVAYVQELEGGYPFRGGLRDLAEPMSPFMRPSNGSDVLRDRPMQDDLERRYRTLVEQLPLIIYVDALDAESSNLFTSRQTETVLGYTPEEWATDKGLFVRVLHPDDRERVMAAHARTHETHERLSLEYRLFARDGRVVWLRDEGVVVLDDDGRPL
jgi:PAS domain S-box-containing protein